MIKKVIVLLFLTLFYQLVAVSLLYSSDYLNVVSYYTHPPIKGGIELKRLPFLFGDRVALSILKLKNAEAGELVKSGDVGMAAILSSYQHNQSLTEVAAKQRSFQIAELFVVAGYDISRCEADSKSTATVLQDWGVLDKEIKAFLVQVIKSDDIFSCR